MCLYTKQKEPLIAKEPIKAFKILIRDSENKLLSPYRDYDYTECVNSHCTIIDAIPKAEYNPIYYLGDSRVVNRGLHLYINKIKAIDLAIGLDGVLFECRIPVDSYYFLSEDETEICANQFQFIKEIDI